jgi:ABC-type amino acid transport substrate-binding protein
MKNKIAVLSLVVALIALLVVALRPAGRENATPAKQETAFDRVMRTKTIRCGYAIWSPVLFKDLKTGEIKGISHDIMEEIGKKLSLRIEWAEETNWGTVVEGLATHRYDAICTGIGVISGRAREIDFSAPLFYAPTYLVVRADENRIHKTDDANDPAYTISVLDGEAFSFLAPVRFPKAQIKSLPQMNDFSSILQEVETKKADATGVTYSDFLSYDKANPGKVKILDKTSPLQVYAASFGLPQGDVAFKTMIDVALGELFFDGTADRIIRVYSDSEEFFRPIKPYALSSH